MFWRGLTGILAGVANWFTVILGMRDDSKYGRFIRRVVGGCFTLVVLMLTAAMAWSFYLYMKEEFGRDMYSDEDSHYDQYVSRNVTFYADLCGSDGYVETAEGKKTLTGIQWIAKPLGHDSLVCFSNGKARGYFNMFTGEPVVRPRYRHAWIFSEGLAAVDDQGWIKFIDSSGKVAIDPQIPYRPGADGYVFRGGHCVMPGERRDRLGLIDRQGRWALEPEFFSIEPRDTFWVVDNGSEQGVLTASLDTLIPFLPAELYVRDGYVSAHMADHTIRRYNLRGELLNDFYISNVYFLEYDTSDLRYVKTKYYDDEGNLTSEAEEGDVYRLQATARCKRYETQSGWYGLMDTNGKIITPPAYSSITAVDYDLYLCMDDNEDGVLLNGKGERVD